MIGVVAVSHGDIALEMVKATRRILPDARHVCAVSIESNDPPESMRRQVAEALASVDTGKGVIILTDMFGGTPSNICLSFLKERSVEVVSGFNLPMLIKLASIKEGADFEETVAFIHQYGQRNIVIASKVLAGTMKGR